MLIRNIIFFKIKACLGVLLSVLGNSLGKFYTPTNGHMTRKKHYKKSDFVLVKSLVQRKCSKKKHRANVY